MQIYRCLTHLSKVTVNLIKLCDFITTLNKTHCNILLENQVYNANIAILLLNDTKAHFRII